MNECLLFHEWKYFYMTTTKHINRGRAFSEYEISKDTPHRRECIKCGKEQYKRDQIWSWEIFGCKLEMKWKGWV